jgi:hypothetical protein
MAGGSPVPINDGGPLRRSHEEFEYVPGSYQSPRGCGPLCFGHWVPAFIQHSFGDTTVSLKVLQEVEGIAGACIRDLRKKKGSRRMNGEFAAPAGLNRTPLCRLESGRAKHHSSGLQRLCPMRSASKCGSWFRKYESRHDHPQSVCSVVPSQSWRVCLSVGDCYFSSPGGMLRRSASRSVSYQGETSSGREQRANRSHFFPTATL